MYCFIDWWKVCEVEMHPPKTPHISFIHIEFYAFCCRQDIPYRKIYSDGQLDDGRFQLAIVILHHFGAQ